ncbi:MAG: Hint domain-containing protein [Alphaproteobacteria bacterium]|nr:Hint domain-containing protein [Alphaproteobacteria bacterium]
MVELGGSTLTLGTSMLVTASGFPGAIQFGGGGTVVNLGTLLANSAINLPGTFINAGTVAIFSNNQSAASNFVNNGLVEITDGSFLVSALAGTGTVELMSNAGQTALLAAPTIGAGQTLLRLSGSFIIEANSIDPQAIISGFNAGSSVRINGLVDTGNVNADFTGTVASGTLTVTNSGSVVASWHLVNVAPGLTFVPAAVGGNTFIEAVACFAAGTGIATPSGVRPVETLRAGDAVCLAAGGQANLRWVGHRKIDPRRHARPQDVCPVRVRVGAFGPGVPQRDLRLSPDHAIACDDILIPVRYLINGLTICQEPAKMVQYFHLELPDHALILAEGLACESYLDTGNRGAFANGGDSPMLHADFARGVWARRGCAPLVIDGPRLESARRAVAAVAAAQGERITEDAALRLVVDGRVVPGERNGPVWSYRLPAGANRVRILSRRWCPVWVDPGSDDARQLGVAIARIKLDGRVIALDDVRLSSGWHAMEPETEVCWRWTDGDSGLALAGVRSIEFAVAMTGKYWVQHHRDRTGGPSRRAA